MKIPYGRMIILAATVAVAAGCATQTRTESEFGDSVRAVSTSQIYDLGAAQYPAEEAVTGGNPDRLANVVKSHRENVGEAQQVKQSIQVSGGGSSGSSSNR